MPDRYDLRKCECKTEDGDCCDAEMETHPQGDYVTWDDYKELLDAWNRLNEDLQDTLYNAPEFTE